MVLVDSNVILDILTRDTRWYDWSADILSHLANANPLLINDIIYSEISIGFRQIEELEEALLGNFVIHPIPKEALFLAGKIFLQYRKQGGTKTSTLPYFFIGAHAAVKNIPLLTRDITRYKNYFPTVKLITP